MTALLSAAAVKRPDVPRCSEAFDRPGHTKAQVNGEIDLGFGGCARRDSNPQPSDP